MNWIRENKFLTGLLAVTLVGVAVLGYLLMSARGEYLQSSETYEQQANELKRLQSLKPYPEQANLDKLLAAKKAFSEQVADLRKTLAAVEFPMEPTTPEQFQDKLRATVSEIQKLAAEKKVTLDPTFYLGFPEYQASPPRGEAAPRLAWQLQTIAFVVRNLIDNRVAAIASVDRDPLPEEATAPATPTPGVPATKALGEALVERYPFQVGFTAEQSRFRATLNQFANTKKQFLIVETLRIANEQEKGPSRAGPAVAPETPPAPAEGVGEGGKAPGEGGGAPRLQFVVGNEKLVVALRIAAVHFPPPKATAKKQ